MEKLIFVVPIAIMLFVISCVKNIILCFLVFTRHKKKKKIEVKRKTEIIVFACLSDIIAFSISILILMIVFNDFVFFFQIDVIYLYIVSAIIDSTFSIKCIGVLVGMLCIFLFDYFVAFRKWADVSKKHKLWLSVVFAVINAPYLYLIDVKIIFSILFNLN